MSTVWLFPPGADDPVDTSKVGVSLVMPYGVWGRMPERTPDDAIRSVKKHVAEVLDEIGGPFLAGFDDNGDAQAAESWEVRLWDEQFTFRFPFARVAATGPVLPTPAHPLYTDLSLPMTVHLYPWPAQDSERAILGADRLVSVIQRALSFGGARGGPLRIPLWDFGAAPGLYDDTEARHPSDFVRVESLSVERLLDPEDARHAWVVVNFRAQWRQVSSRLPGHLVESVRVSAHPR